MNSLPPTILTIFGATGDLSANYLLPALLHLDMEGLLPEDFQLVCVGRRPFDDDKFLNFILGKSASLKKLAGPKARARFKKRLAYYQGDFDNPESFRPLAERLADRERPRHVCYNRLYYFATSPQYFAAIARLLKESGLLMACETHERKIRILAEKPFGFNLESARDLNRLLLKYFSEDQIYRIDHYQGKETVQNLMIARFANGIFEPLWNRSHIEHIEISVLEKERVAGRAPYYDESGALKDMVQNHLLQMLALIAMDKPKDMGAESIRDEKVKVLKALRPFGASAIVPLPRREGSGGISDIPWLVRGQYSAYPAEAGRESETETYVAMKTFVDSARWKGVPFYLRTGKALHKKVAEVSVHFRQPDRCLFEGCAPNVLTFRIQPDESVQLSLNNKIPGFGVRLHRANLNFSYEETFKENIPPAYERLLLDFMQGDQRLFVRSDEIEAAWKFVDSAEASGRGAPLYAYEAGGEGPAEAADFMSRDGREWRTK